MFHGTWYWWASGPYHPIISDCFVDICPRDCQYCEAMKIPSASDVHLGLKRLLGCSEISSAVRCLVCKWPRLGSATCTSQMSNVKAEPTQLLQLLGKRRVGQLAQQDARVGCLSNPHTHGSFKWRRSGFHALDVLRCQFTSEALHMRKVSRTLQQVSESIHAEANIDRMTGVE